MVAVLFKQMVLISPVLLSQLIYDSFYLWPRQICQSHVYGLPAEVNNFYFYGLYARQIEIYDNLPSDVVVCLERCSLEEISKVRQNEIS